MTGLFTSSETKIYGKLLLTLYIGSGHNSFRTVKGWGIEKAVHSFHGSLYLQKGDTSKHFEVSTMNEE